MDNKIIHKLIDFAFFMPRSGMMEIKDLIFNDIEDLLMKFPKNVMKHLEKKIMIKEESNLILMPCYMKNAFENDSVITPI